MAIMVESLFRERKYQFVFSPLILLICVTLLLFSNSTSTPTINSVVFYPDVKGQPSTTPFVAPISFRKDQALSQKVPPDTALKAEVPQNLNPITFPKDEGLPESELPISEPKDQELPQKKGDIDIVPLDVNIDWKLCEGPTAVDNIPCLDNFKVIKALKSRRHMEHRERHCPDPTPQCLVPLPNGYKVPVPWPKSRDMIWYNNVPHPKLVEYKKDQHWVVKSGEYLVFPGGGTQFKDGVNHYIEYIQKTLPEIQWGKNIRVVLDVGCGVASFGVAICSTKMLRPCHLPQRMNMKLRYSLLWSEEFRQLSVIGTQKLTFPNNGYDLIHCARCRVHWDADGGKPLFELNRILRPGGFFAWSATPVYRDDERDQKVWNGTMAVIKSMCGTAVARTFDSSGIGTVIYQNPQPEQPEPELAAPRSPSLFRRVRISTAVLRALGSGRSGVLSNSIALPGSGQRIVVYFTSLRVVRRTSEDCRAVRSILRGFRVSIDERDVSMDDRFLDELHGILGRKNETLPRVFIGGTYIGGADDVKQLHESGELRRLIEQLPRSDPDACDLCGGMRFVVCDECNGSHKVYMEKSGFRSCTSCNVNGLIGAPLVLSCSRVTPNNRPHKSGGPKGTGNLAIRISSLLIT